MTQRFFTGLVLSLVVLGASACSQRAPQTGPAQAPIVPVSQPVSRDVTDFVEFTGRTDAINSVDVRARVTGYLVQIPFKEGSEVKKGDLLFEIDPRPYQSQLDQAVSQVQLYQAQLRLARTTLRRDEAVNANAPGAVSPQQLDQDRAQVDEATARVTAAQSATEVYKLNLAFTKVTSPIDGMVSRYYLTLGNLVNQDQTLLTTVVSLDPIYGYFDMDEPTLLRIKRAINEGRIKLPTKGQDIPVYLGLQGEEGFPHRGSINFLNNAVNPSTGTILVRGVFPNPKPPTGTRLLLPGMFARIRLPIGAPYQALLVVDRAIGSDQGLKFVYTVDNQNKIQYRRVSTGPLQDDGLRVIEEIRFQITDAVLANLQKGGLPEQVSQKLAPLKGKIITGKANFLTALRGVLDRGEMEKYQESLLSAAVLEGLFPEERVVVGGLQKVRPNMEVRPDPVPMPTPGAQPQDQAATRQGNKPQPPPPGEKKPAGGGAKGQNDNGGSKR